MLKERRIRLEKERRQKARKFTQRCLGLMMIAISAMIIHFCANANNPQDKDATVLLFLIPMGVYLLFSKEDCLM